MNCGLCGSRGLVQICCSCSTSDVPDADVNMDATSTVTGSSADGARQDGPHETSRDDVAVTKFISLLILTLMSAVCCATSGAIEEVILMAATLGEIEEAGLEIIYRIIERMTYVLLSGKWPSLDPNGKPWPKKSCRHKLAGKDCRSGLCFVVSDIIEGWKWLKEALHLPQW